MKRIMWIIALAVCFLIITEPVLAVVTESTRIFGLDRYKTANAISEQVNRGLVNNVVLVPGSNFANALPASVLANKLKAPILLIDSTAGRTAEAFEYITNHLTKIGTIYLVGDSSLVGKDFEVKLNLMGYKNIVLIKGMDKYETDYLIAQELDAPLGSPIIISSGESFPDALAISSFAAAYGWPILLAGQNGLTPELQEYIRSKQPSKIYITGGIAAISSRLEQELGTLAPQAKIQRFAGSDRYATAVQIAREFAPGPFQVYVSSGINFPDALAGSVLAAKNNAPIILVNPLAKELAPDVKSYLQSLKDLKTNTRITFLGGTTVIPRNVEVQVCLESSLAIDKFKVVEEEVISLVNKERTDRGLPALLSNEVLAKLARLKSKDMIDQKYFDHQSPTYGSPFEMMKSFGITYQNAGENIARGQSTAEEVMKAWMNSPGHMENILKEEYQEIGVGAAEDSNGQIYWTQMFIRP